MLEITSILQKPVCGATCTGAASLASTYWSRDKLGMMMMMIRDGFLDMYIVDLGPASLRSLESLL